MRSRSAPLVRRREDDIAVAERREAAVEPSTAPPAPLASGPAAGVLALQRHVGNCAVAGMLAGSLTMDESEGVEKLPAAGPGIFVGEADVDDQTPGVAAPDADSALGGESPAAVAPAAAPADGGAPAAAPADGGAPAAAPVVINSRTDMHAPDGTADTRTTVAMGEVVYFDVGGAAADWTASVGWPLRRAGRDTFAWELPQPGTATITATLPAGGAASVTMTAIAPKNIRMRKVSEDPPGTSGTANAGMMLVPRFMPANVNFGNVEWLEVPGPPSNLTGYFAAQVAGGTNLNHVPNPNFLRIGPGLRDHAAAFGFPPPYSAGSWDWSIPNRFRRAGTGDTGVEYVTTLQSFRMDATGSITVSKQGASVTKAPIP
jgi:hypothetical protein